MSFVGLNTAYTGLIAAQFGLDTSSHNVSNANTDGFTRQRIEQVARLPLFTPFGQIGTGVELVDITRSRDSFLDARVRTGQTVLGAMVLNSELMLRAEQLLGEPDFGISRQLDDVWDAWENLALDPTDQGSRVAVLNALDGLASRVNQVSTAITGLHDDTNDTVAIEVDDINLVLGELAELNKQIADQGGQGGSSNDLMDQRDQLLDDVARRIGANVLYSNDGTVRVSLNGMALVDGARANAMTYDKLTYELIHSTNTVLNPSGELGGRLAFLTQDVPTLRADLNAFVVDVADNMNAQHALGFYDPGTPGAALFTYTPGSEADTLALAITDPAELAASDDLGPPFPLFNGINAQALADLRSALVAQGGTDTLSGYIRQIISEVGAKTSGVERATAAQQDLVTAAELSRTAQHGVNLDEEMVNLMRYQRAYQASSRVITTVDSALDTLINRTGIVGR